MKFILKNYLPTFIITFILVSVLLLLSNFDFNLIKKASNLETRILIIFYGNSWIISISILTASLFSSFVAFRKLNISLKEDKTEFSISSSYFLKYLILIAVVIFVVILYFNFNMLPEHNKNYVGLYHKIINPLNQKITLNEKNPRIDRGLPREMTYSELIGAIEIVEHNLSSNESPNFTRYNQKKSECMLQN